LVSWLVEFASPLVKVSIVPRGQSLGAAWYLPEERQITTTEQLVDEMCAALGGRAAEEVMFNKISTGALSDLEKVTKQAYAMVTIYGLNARIGNRSYYDSTGDQSFTKPYSEETSRIIDEEVSILIEGAYDRAKDILRTNKEKLEGLAESLLENEVIFKEDLKRILGERPFASAQEIPVAVPVQSTSDKASVEADSTEEVPADDKAVSDEASDLAESSDQSDSSDAAAILPSEGA
jgi:ATP-dependent Zn protease